MASSTVLCREAFDRHHWCCNGVCYHAGGFRTHRFSRSIFSSGWNLICWGIRFGILARRVGPTGCRLCFAVSFSPCGRVHACRDTIHISWSDCVWTTRNAAGTEATESDASKEENKDHIASDQMKRCSLNLIRLTRWCKRMLELILFLVAAFPVAWLVAEFYEDRCVRIALGVCAIAMSFGVAWIVGSLDRLQSNVYFSEATKDLIQNTIVELEYDRSDVVLAELRALRDDFQPTYETRDDYDVLVDRYIHSISESPVEHSGGNPLWSHQMVDQNPPATEKESESSDVLDH